MKYNVGDTVLIEVTILKKFADDSFIVSKYPFTKDKKSNSKYNMAIYDTDINSLITKQEEEGE